MTVEPYVPKSVRSKLAWEATAKILGVHPVVARQGYINRWAGCLSSREFHKLVAKKEIVATNREFINTLSPEELEERLANPCQESDFGDRLNYICKSRIEVGDELVSADTKTFCFGGQQYQTKGNRYKVLSLTDDGPCDVAVVTESDIPGEKIWWSVHGIISIWRNGIEIYNWSREYLTQWMAENPDHPKTQEMVAFCNKRAAESALGTRE